MSPGNDVAEKLRRWEAYLQDYKLPQWEEIPDLGLYMEQVLLLLTEYLDYLPPELRADQFITAATVNNYVRNKFMPPPVKKKYYRSHIAYLIVICSLKQRLNIATIHKMLPMGISEQEVRTIYTAFANQYMLTAKYFVGLVRVIAAPIMGYEDLETEISVDRESDLISLSAILSCLSGLLAEKLLLLPEEQPEPEQKPGQEKKPGKEKKPSA